MRMLEIQIWPNDVTETNIWRMDESKKGVAYILGKDTRVQVHIYTEDSRMLMALRRMLYLQPLKNNGKRIFHILDM